jgi:AraC-like DNA-binding protein
VARPKPLAVTPLDPFVSAALAFTTLDLGCAHFGRDGWCRVLYQQRCRASQYQNLFDKFSVRSEHNERLIRAATRTRRPQLLSLFGLWSLAVPAFDETHSIGHLLAGSFLRREPSRADIIECWRTMSGRNPEPHDPAFYAFAREVIALPVLDEPLLGVVAEVLEIVARSLTTKPTVGVVRRIERLRSEHCATRPAGYLRRSLEFIDPLVNARFSEGRLEPWDIDELGIREVPNAVIAAHPTAPHQPEQALDHLLLVERFARESVPFCRSLGDTVAAKLEDVGVYFFMRTESGRASRTFLQERARAIASFAQQQMGLRVHIGIGGASRRPTALPDLARDAAAAMRLAIHRDVPIVSFKDEKPSQGALSDRVFEPARTLERALAARDAQTLRDFGATLDDYVRDVSARSGGDMGMLRVHFSYFLVGLLARTRSQAGATSVLYDIEAEADRALERAQTSAALFAAFRVAVERLVAVDTQAEPEGRAQRLERAAALVREHCDGALDLVSMAAKVGMSASHFSRLFHAHVGVPFRAYVRQVRVEHAKRLLREGHLSTRRAGQEAGFLSAAQFCRAFKAATGHTPGEYQRLLAAP